MWNRPISRAANQTAERINLGWQCPNCYGVNINMRRRQPHDPYKYECQECGENWSRPAHQES